MSFGLLLVAGVLAVFFLVGINLGWLILDGWKCQEIQADAWLRTLWVGLLVNLCVAVGEETIFRGYLLTSLDKIWGNWKALIVMSAVFGLFHLVAYSESGLQSRTLALAILLATLFGVLFGWVRLQTGSLWLPVTLHFAWNFIENDVLNLTGDLSNVNLVGAVTHIQAPLTMTEVTLGNMVFIETIAFAIISLGLWLWLRGRATPARQLE
jgi:membrane protease YdiL (CAAX protease family)